VSVRDAPSGKTLFSAFGNHFSVFSFHFSISVFSFVVNNNAESLFVELRREEQSGAVERWSGGARRSNGQTWEKSLRVEKGVVLTAVSSTRLGWTAATVVVWVHPGV